MPLIGCCVQTLIICSCNDPLWANLLDRVQLAHYALSIVLVPTGPFRLALRSALPTPVSTWDARQLRTSTDDEYQPVVRT